MWTYKIFYNKFVDKKRGFRRKVLACIFYSHYTDTISIYGITKPIDSEWKKDADWSYLDNV